MKTTLRLTLAMLVFSVFSIKPAAAAPPVSDSFAIAGVRVFDGAAVIPGATVIVRQGKIAAVGANVAVPADVPVIDGSGSTLMPGIIDAHSHARTREELERALQFGVTTELDMWTLRHFANSMRREQDRNGAPYRADFFSAISPATLPEGYPYNFTPQKTEKPTLSSPAEAEAFVADRFAEGSDYLKIMIEDGSLTNFETPAIGRDTVRALTAAVHRRGKLAVAHVTEHDHAADAVADGVDGLAHIFLDTLADSAFVQQAVTKGIFVVGTLAVEESFITTDGGASLIADPDLAPYLTAEEIQFLLTPAPPSTLTPENLRIAQENVRRLHAAGVPILGGSDMPAHGVALHREVELLVQAGLDPVDALAAVTSNPAAAFRLADRGRIAPGLRADLLLVHGDPTVNIKATRAIQRIWKGGVEVDRQPAAERVHAEH
jgi:imidazolonepropionase-like amidohydrolase